MRSQMMRVISSPSSSTSGFASLFFAMEFVRHLSGKRGLLTIEPHCVKRKCYETQNYPNAMAAPEPAPAPTIILSEPQLGENIGACARAMANFGLSDLRLVKPRDGWPNPKADAMAASAVRLIEAARVYDSVQDAIGTLRLVFAATARDRAMAKPVLTPGEAARRLREASAQGVATGLMFGNQRAGHGNDDAALADCSR